MIKVKKKPIIYNKQTYFNISVDPDKPCYVGVHGYLLDITIGLELFVFNHAQRSRKKSPAPRWRLTELSTGWCVQEASTRGGVISEFLRDLKAASPKKIQRLLDDIKEVVGKYDRANPDFKILLSKVRTKTAKGEENSVN